MKKRIHLEQPPDGGHKKGNTLYGLICLLLNSHVEQFENVFQLGFPDVSLENTTIDFWHVESD